MLPVIEIPLLQQSQCQYHNNFFCHVVYERIQEHGGSKGFSFVRDKCLWSFSNLSGQLCKNCILHSCCKSSGPLNDFCSHYLIFFFLELLHIGLAWLFWQNITVLDGGFSVLANIDDVSAFYARCGVLYSFYLI